DPGGPAGTSGGSIGCTVYDGRGGGGSAALAALASTAGVSARDRIMIITAIEPSSAAPAITTYSGHAARGAACSRASGPGSTASGAAADGPDPSAVPGWVGGGAASGNPRLAGLPRFAVDSTTGSSDAVTERAELRSITLAS